MYGILRERFAAISWEDDFFLGFYYCSLCHGLRENFGSVYGILANWECRFLALLVDAQLIDTNNLSSTRCPARCWLAEKTITANDLAIKYASGINLLLFAEKMEDNLRDNNSSCAKYILRLTKRSVECASDLLTELNFPVQALYDLRNRQIRLEGRSGCYEIDEVTLPSGMAVSLILAHTAKLSGVETNYQPLLDIGSDLGRAITVIDACNDYSKDAKQSRFNAIAAIFPDNTNRLPLTPPQFGLVENYLFVLLYRIRSKYQKLNLYKHSRLVQNILFLGLFDVAKNSLFHLRKNLAGGTIKYGTIKCDACGTEISSLFCSHCGKNRYGFVQ